MVEQQVDVEVVTADFQMNLATDEGKARTQLDVYKRQVLGVGKFAKRVAADTGTIGRQINDLGY